jgi:hypothetical protein
VVQSYTIPYRSVAAQVIDRQNRCANAAEEKMAAVAATINVRITHFSR